MKFCYLQNNPRSWSAWSHWLISNTTQPHNFKFFINTLLQFTAPPHNCFHLLITLLLSLYLSNFAAQFTEDGSFIGQYVPGKLQPPVSPQPINNTPAAHQSPTAPPAPTQGTTTSNTAAVATYV
ncbi:PREDICTED: uncharacterized protein LOC108364004 [Rhagoletis zephyria]|uniref:uncharacterized protein LOC108364004 n=1 Tax=Rhagoletis zephyria TaxID=28612 RepID=UPI0008112DAB|nr:PREDICTED: uncharacterized protein LOC108364004 [Rhagoletis zephyria]